jgi:hypothetical protein
MEPNLKSNAKSNVKSNVSNVKSNVGLKSNPNKGLIKTHIKNLESLFNSKAFELLYRHGAITLRNPSNPLSNPPKSQQYIDSWVKEARDTKTDKKISDKLKDLAKEPMEIISIDVKDDSGFIEFGANDFPIRALSLLAPNCKEPSKNSKDSKDSKDSKKSKALEVIWLNPKKSKFTHTIFGTDGKSKFNEYDFCELDGLFQKPSEGIKENKVTKPKKKPYKTYESKGVEM